MFQLNSLNEVGMFFLVIAGELVLLFIGVTFLVGLLQEFIPPETIKKILIRRRKFEGNIVGAALGSLTPFCSCSTIPIVVGLLNGGAPFGAAMSFLVASPLLNPVILGLFLSLLGLKVAAVYAGITFLAAIFIGMLWEGLGLADQYKEVIIRRGCCSGEGIDHIALITEPVTLSFKFKRAGGMAWTLFRQVFPYLLLGAAIGAFIYGFVPESLVLKWTGPGNPLAVPVAAIIGVPMYIRAETIIPISAVLLGKGMSIGAVMALVIGGAGASIPEIVILASIFRRKLVVAFVITILAVATMAGFFFNLAF